ncbi:MAG: hypothetical protein K2I95_07865 [Treponemataceae bacterium]|nr:hypothetical protein [Treponemataceae bacterium]
MKKNFVAVFAFMLVAVLSAQTAHKRPSVVIMPFDAKGGVSQEDCEVITEEFMSKYAVVGNSVVVNRNTLAQIQTEQMFQSSDWSDSNKTTRLGEALNAQQIVSGQLRLYNGLIFVIVQVQDIRTLAVLASVNVRVKDVMELLDKISGICKSISAQMNGEYAVFSMAAKYQIGDIGPGGGYVFYYSEEGFSIIINGKEEICHYLECSPQKLGEMTWCSCPRYSTSKKKVKNSRDVMWTWCKIETADGIGAGKDNTYNIINASHPGGTINASNCAAYACNKYSTRKTKAGDWYLPSKIELDLIYENLVKRGKIPAEGRHWSSFYDKTDNEVYVKERDFSNGRDRGHIKSGVMCVRAVHAF